MISLTVFGTFIVGAVLWVQLLSEPDTDPCAPDRYPGRCYRVNRSVCESIWSKANVDCKKKIQELKLSPTRLTGPIQFKCQLTVLDRLISYTRQNNTECNQLHKELDQWQRTNPDF